METTSIALLIIAGIAITAAIVVVVATAWIVGKIVKSNPFCRN